MTMTGAKIALLSVLPAPLIGAAVTGDPLIEAAKQVPALAVFVLLAMYVLTHLKHISNAHHESIERIVTRFETRQEQTDRLLQQVVVALTRFEDLWLAQRG